MTIACTPRRLASSTIAAPVRRARTVAVATVTPSYSSPTALARASAPRARLSCASGSAASMGSDIGSSKTQIASTVEPTVSSKVSSSCSAGGPPGGGAGLVEGALVLLGGEPAGGLHDVVVELVAEDRHEDRAVLGVGPPA